MLWYKIFGLALLCASFWTFSHIIKTNTEFLSISKMPPHLDFSSNYFCCCFRSVCWFWWGFREWKRENVACCWWYCYYYAALIQGTENLWFSFRKTSNPVENAIVADTPSNYSANVIRSVSSIIEITKNCPLNWMNCNTFWFRFYGMVPSTGTWNDFWNATISYWSFKNHSDYGVLGCFWCLFSENCRSLFWVYFRRSLVFL